MNEYPPFFERNWKRPSDVVPFPNIWSRFEVKSKSDGQIYKMKIQDLTPDRYEEVWEMYRKHFFGEEELIKSANAIEDEETMTSQKWNFHQCVKENLSVITVLDNDDPKPTIVGGLLLAVLSENDPLLPKLPGKARAKVHNLFSRVFNGIDMFKTLEVNHHFEDYGLVVKPEYRRLGIGTELFKTIEIMAKTFKTPAVVVVPNNSSSQALIAKLGYTVLNEAKLSDYLDNNWKMILPTVHTKVVQLTYRRFL